METEETTNTVEETVVECLISYIYANDNDYSTHTSQPQNKERKRVKLQLVWPYPLPFSIKTFKIKKAHINHINTNFENKNTNLKPTMFFRLFILGSSLRSVLGSRFHIRQLI